MSTSRGHGGRSPGGRGSIRTYLSKDKKKGSLFCVLHNYDEATGLDWTKRLKIIQGVAHALSYLHHDCTPSIVRRDLSSNNILLNSESRAFVADFGLARLLHLDSSNRTMLAGIYGYIAPAYAPLIHLVPHPSSWVLPEHVSSCVVHPLEGRRQSGRPKKIRICSSLEGPKTRVCTNCGKSGHNFITCTKPRQARSISKSSSSSIGRKPSFRRQRACGRCGLLGHNIQTCSNLEAKP
ncbi:hypothetical protein Ddye_025506 [Dipteronia dyeriana]|uniref:non-specific serine/threonine protein kinase n=1 Tax=Dipteronia dyeriana TaxID=168575 RepID=A0AAD9WNL3_9ROSI|nr:hypothetical protein Ddye_025506 [Dipteronia dyeriana]